MYVKIRGINMIWCFVTVSKH